MGNRRALARTDGRHPGQGSSRGTYTTIWDPEKIVYVPVGLGGRNRSTDDGVARLGGLGVIAAGLGLDLFAMIKALSAPAAWEIVPTEALKWQLPLL
ncbi:MAG: hypothetical protein ALECFALPRED_010209 [Alectoria fallacina]|uniref:Uncharacterized protein n=1 Tax=Alectoria fallacina TaxID=1903189 RepID=A0A8H3PK51_9LECA|nr:MAG: hypothetical protein ALECFALPRED_010209 [Alectoria fallacina]